MSFIVYLPPASKKGISNSPSICLFSFLNNSSLKTAVSSGKCPRNVESPRWIMTKGMPIFSETRTILSAISICIFVASSSNTPLELVRIKNRRLSPSKPLVRDSSLQSVKTEMSCTDCTPVGSSSKTTILNTDSCIFFCNSLSISNDLLVFVPGYVCNNLLYWLMISLKWIVCVSS